MCLSYALRRLVIRQTSKTDVPYDIHHDDFFSVDMDPASAVRTAKMLRPIIDPIGHLPDLLERLHSAKKSRKAIKR